METCVHLGLPLLPEGPQDRGAREAGRSGSAHLPISSAGDRPSSQLAKLRPRLQAPGELLGGGVGLGLESGPSTWPQAAGVESIRVPRGAGGSLCPWGQL